MNAKFFAIFAPLREKKTDKKLAKLSGVGSKKSIEIPGALAKVNPGTGRLIGVAPENMWSNWMVKTGL